MNKPRILVTAAAGKTGLPVALHLLNEGFPVTALVRREDARSARLKSHGATIVAGSLTDVHDVRQAMQDAQRAYFCTPILEGNVKAAAVFVAVAAEQKHSLESVVAMSQWLSNPAHPSVHTRETWLSDKLFALLPGTAVTTINPGIFADIHMQVLPFAAQFGLMMAPYGSGMNAPVSNEDMARVAAEIVARPDGHAGRTYRPTGPALLSPQDITAAFARVLERQVRYVNIPIWVFSKVAKGMGFSDFMMAQVEKYFLDYQQNAFAVNAPTDVVRAVTGREPEDFETITRRYVANLPDAKPSLPTQARFMAMMNVWMLLRLPNPFHLATGDFSNDRHIYLSSDSAEWRQGHEPAARANAELTGAAA